MLHKNRLGEWSKMTPHVARRKKALVCYLNFPVFAIKVLLLHGRPDRGTGLHYCSKCHDLRRRGYDVLMAAEHELKRELKKLPLPIYWEMWNYLGRDPYVE